MSKLSRRQFLKLSLTGVAGLGLPQVLAPAAEAAEAAAIFCAQPAAPVIALTHDDGYVNVASLLEVCRTLGLRLTLFPIGRVIDARPRLWQQAVADGHEIGCHTYSHLALGGQAYGVIARELELFMATARRQLGLSRVRFFRPPYGSGWSEPAVQAAAADFGMRVVMWNRTNPMNELSPNPTAQHVVDGFCAQARPGDICLHHFKYQEVGAMRAIVDYCRGRGWHVGTLSQLLGLEPPAASAAQAEYAFGPGGPR